MKVKVAVYGTVGRVVTIDTDPGATIGRDFRMADGTLATAEKLREFLGIGSGSEQQHKDLQGLQRGDDHPQYTMWNARERITARWEHTQRLTVLSYDGFRVSNPDTGTDDARAGIELTTFSGANPGGDGIGNQLAFWESPGHDFGFRFRHEGQVDITGDLVFYQHENSTAGVEVFRFKRDVNQLRAAAGTAAAPWYSFDSDPTKGMYSGGAEVLSFATGGIERGRFSNAGGVTRFRVGNNLTAGLTYANSVIEACNQGTVAIGVRAAGSSVEAYYGAFNGGGWIGTVTNHNFQFYTNDTLVGHFAATGPLQLLDGSQSAPPFSFISDPDTGPYSVSPNVYGISVGGTLRFSFTTAQVTSTLPLRGANGSAAAPTFAYSGDVDNGMFLAAADAPAFASAGVERLRFGPNGQWGLAGANYGDDGQVLTSSGPGLPPTWQNPAGGGGSFDASFATYVTWQDEGSFLPNSLRIVAGAGIALDIDTNDQLTISAMGASSSIDAEIAADSPTGYWKLTETSGTQFLDSSGNGFHMNHVGTVSLASAYIVPNDHTTPSAKWLTGVNGGLINSVLGTSPPLAGDYTVEAIANLRDLGAILYLFTMGKSGELEADNFQIEFFVSAVAVPTAFWETGAGTNQTVASGITLVEGRTYHLAMVKDGTANTITFYVNGTEVAVVTYSPGIAEPTGGTSASMNSAVGAAADGSSTNASSMAHVAFYNGQKLSAARIAAHAKAAGLMV